MPGQGVMIIWYSSFSFSKWSKIMTFMFYKDLPGNSTEDVPEEFGGRAWW